MKKRKHEIPAFLFCLLLALSMIIGAASNVYRILDRNEAANSIQVEPKIQEDDYQGSHPDNPNVAGEQRGNDTSSYPLIIVSSAAYTPTRPETAEFVDSETGEHMAAEIIYSDDCITSGGSERRICVCDTDDGKKLVAPFNFPLLDKESYPEALQSALAYYGIEAQIYGYSEELRGWPMLVNATSTGDTSNQFVSSVAYYVAERTYPAE